MTSSGETLRAVELSVVIAAKDAVASLPGQLDALLAQDWTGAWEIVVADNGSTDETRELVGAYAQRDGRLRLIDASSRPGAGFARNSGMSQARGRLFAFCDSDDVVAPGWVAAMADGLRSHDAIGGRNMFDLLNPPWVQQAFYAEPPDQLETFAGIFPFAGTCNLGVRRSVAEAVGGFDEGFLIGQDMEFCLRLWLGGYELAYVPAAVVQYRYRPDMTSLYRRSRDYGSVAPAIARRLSEAGRTTPRRWVGLKSYLWLLRKAPLLVSRAGRARWLVVAGGKVGRIRGSIRERWAYL